LIGRLIGPTISPLWFASSLTPLIVDGKMGSSAASISLGVTKPGATMKGKEFPGSFRHRSVSLLSGEIRRLAEEKRFGLQDAGSLEIRSMGSFSPPIR
jgi:hypothetical protein